MPLPFFISKMLYMRTRKAPERTNSMKQRVTLLGVIANGSTSDARKLLKNKRYFSNILPINERLVHKLICQCRPIEVPIHTIIALSNRPLLADRPSMAYLFFSIKITKLNRVTKSLNQ